MADDDMLSWDDSIFRDERVLELDYLPETFLHRDDQMETLKYALRPAVRGSRPLDVLIRGPSGTGKTTAIQKLFHEFSDTTNITATRVNCQVDSTRYAVFSRLFESLFEYEPPTSGTSFDYLFEQITDYVIEEDTVLIVALDDVNYLFYNRVASEILYSLLRANEVNPEVRIGIVAISSDLDLDVIENLDSHIEAIFEPENIYFDTYGKDDVVDILQERVESGFKKGAVGTQVLNQISKYTASSGGDLRIGIDLLRRSGLNAEMRGATKISVEDVDKAHKKARNVHVRRHVRGLSENSKKLLRIICLRNRTNEATTKRAIQNEFTDTTDSGVTKFSKNLDTLDQLGLIKTGETRDTDQGIKTQIKPISGADVVLDILKN